VVVYLKLLLTAVFWGGTFIAGRAIAGSVEPFSAAFLRFAIASILLILLTLRAEGRIAALRRGQMLPLVLAGMTGVFLYNVFFFKGLALITASRASLIVAMNPAFITLAAALFFRDRLNWIKVTGIALSVFGAAVVISKGDLGGIFRGNVGLGEFLILGCVACWVAFSLIGKIVVKGLSPLVSVSYSSAIGAAALFLPACGEDMPKKMISYSLMDWASIFYLGVFGTVLGFVWYYEGIKAIGPAKAGQFINFVPISALLLAFLILGEPVTLSLLVGAAFVISGVYLTNMNLSSGPV
jgi:drug/metabolite transporter (DMT)-like permease